MRTSGVRNPWLFPILNLTIGMLLYPLGVSAQYSSIDELPDGKRQDFEKLYADYKTEFEAQRRSEAETADPLLTEAQRRLDAAMLLNDTADGVRARIRREQQEQQQLQEYGTWLEYRQRIVSTAVFDELASDPEFGAFFKRQSRSLLAATMLAENKPAEWKLIADLLPKNLDDLTEEQAARLFLEWQHKLSDEAALKLQKLAWSPDRLEDEEGAALEDWMRAQPLRVFYKNFVKQHTPEGVIEAGKRLGKIASDMTGIWPGWQAHLHEAEFTELPEFPFPELQQKQPARPPENVRPRVLMLAVNVLLLAAAAAYFMIRHKKQQRRPRAD